MKRINNKKNLYKSIILLVIVVIGIGYAYLTSNLSITGATEVVANTWDIHFENLQVTSGSVAATTSAAIDSNETSINYSITLSRPKDFYEFTVDVVNEGTLPGKVSISELSGLDATSSKVIDYSVKYTYGQPVQVNDILNGGATKTIKVRVYYKDDITEDDFPDNNLNLNLTYTLQYLQSEKDELATGTLLQNLSSSNDCITKYEGQVTDRVGVTETATNVYLNKCVDKRNIIFGGYCWQAVRTTETGGLKMIYNGEPVDGKCESDRENQMGIVKVNTSSLSLDNEFLYGSRFTYNTSSKQFKLLDTNNATWSDSTYDSIIGKYTCKTTNDTCSDLYKINTYKSNTEANYTSYKIDDTKYAQIGTSTFNAKRTSPATVGYMFNKVSIYKSQNYSLREYPIHRDLMSTSIWFADSISWDSPVSNRYSLVNPYQPGSDFDYSTLVGKYTLYSNNVNTTSTNAYYIVYANSSIFCYIILTEGKSVEYFNDKYTYGDNYIENNDGTYTITNTDGTPPSTVSLIDWYENHSETNYKYVCKNAVNNTCDEVWHLGYTYDTDFRYISSINKFKYAKNFTYDENTNTYTLNDNLISMWDYEKSSNIDQLKEAHYTCWNDSGVCTNISYIYAYTSEFHYMELNSGENINDYVNKMLNDDNVNKYNSDIKGIIDNWYSQNIIDKTSLIEDTVYCNNRNIENYGGFNPEGTVGNTSMYFASRGTKKLTCPNITDQFSVNNNKAVLKYPVGLLQYEEGNNINGYLLTNTDYTYWTMSPFVFSTYYAGVHYFGYSNTYDSDVYYTKGVRPVISLASFNTISSGTGSETDPWIVD